MNETNRMRDISLQHISCVSGRVQMREKACDNLLCGSSRRGVAMNASRDAEGMMYNSQIDRIR